MTVAYLADLGFISGKQTCAPENRFFVVVGSFATVARCPARPSDMEAGDVSTLVGVDVTIVVGLVMGAVAPEESC